MALNTLACLFYLIVFFMPFSLAAASRRSQINSAFGVPENWSTDQLPTNLDVGSYFLLKRAELNAGSKVLHSNFEVAKEVNCIK